MTENSARGLTLLDPDREVVLTREEHHQPALSGYAPHGDGRGRRVAAELCFAPIAHGSHAGKRGIEVRLDGRRVGELTLLMSQRYGPLVDSVLRRGARPGCVAIVDYGRRGLEVELRLPEVMTPTAPGRAAPSPPPPARSGAPPRPAPHRNRKPYWIGAGAVALLVVAAVNVGERQPGCPSGDGKRGTVEAHGLQHRRRRARQRGEREDPDPQPETAVHYKNCDAVRAAGKAPIHVGDPGYRAALDGDNDGTGCEN